MTVETRWCDRFEVCKCQECGREGRRACAVFMHPGDGSHKKRRRGAEHAICDQCLRSIADRAQRYQFFRKHSR